MVAWIIGAFAPGLALCVAAALADRAARAWRRPARWIWLAAMTVSILLPWVGPALPQLARWRLPSIQPAWAPGLAPVGPAAGGSVAGLVQAHEVMLARGLWIGLSAATLLLLIGAAMLLRRRARHWRRVVIGEREAYVAPATGPAVIGWWRPRIVLPDWLAAAPARQRDLAIAHEQSHLDAHDPQLLGLAFGLLVIMPWNPALWWQLRRLRHAIEVDCDARLLRGGCDLLDYGETLLALGMRRSQLPGLMSASNESRSFLERRIRIMSAQPNHWNRLGACVLAGLAACVVAVAGELAPAQAVAATAAPATPPAPAAPAVPAMPPLPPLPHLAAVTSLPRPAAVPAVPAAAAAPAESATEVEADSDAVLEAREEAERAAEHAAELKGDAEEAEQAAREAKRDAEEQQAQAEDAKRAAEAAAAEAQARRHDAEDAEREARAASRTK